jgi:hypothetical protein
MASNVLGLIEGSDKKDEYVFITAHYDHIGTRNGIVNNGADDDGSGTVAVMQIGEAFAKAKAEGKSDDEKEMNESQEPMASNASEEEIKEIVFVLEDGKVKPIVVKSGIQDNTYIQILSGLKAGQEVVTGPYSAISKILKEGLEVEKTTPENLNQIKEK